MVNYTTDLYEMKREIINYSKNLIKGLGQVESKFVTEMIYGMMRSQSSIISNISDALEEDIKKINTVELLTRNLNNDMTNDVIYENYMNEVKKVIDDEPIILVDDSDITKPFGRKFEALGMVRDGSSKEKKLEKGYWVTEMTALTKNERHPRS